MFFSFDTIRQKITCAALFAVPSVNHPQLKVKLASEF